MFALLLRVFIKVILYHFGMSIGVYTVKKIYYYKIIRLFIAYIVLTITVFPLLPLYAFFKHEEAVNIAKCHLEILPYRHHFTRIMIHMFQ